MKIKFKRNEFYKIGPGNFFVHFKQFLQEGFCYIQI